jgi:hypothetical protein
MLAAQAKRTATAIATVINGFVVAITITDGGAGYTEPPTVTVSGGGGSGAMPTALVSNGAVWIPLTNVVLTSSVYEWYDRISTPGVQRFYRAAGRLPAGWEHRLLAALDRFEKERLRRLCYVRYMDDFAVWGGSAVGLRAVQSQIEGFLHKELNDLPACHAVSWPE